MSTRNSWITLKFRSIVDVARASKFKSSYVGVERNSPIMSTTRVGSSYWMHSGMQFFSSKSNTALNAKNRLRNDQARPEAPASTIFTFPSWLKWILGTLLSLVLPFWKYNWENLRRIEGEAEAVVEDIEKVAQVVEKVTENVAEILPEDGKLKKAALVVENASKQVAQGAQLTEEFIHKVEAVTNDVEDLESFIEPIIDKIVKKQHEKN